MGDKPFQLGDYLTSINKTKKNIMRDPDTVDPQAVSGFPDFLVRRLLSYHMDAVLYCNELNCLPLLDKQLQYEYLLYALPKKNRFAKLHKTANQENLDLLKRFYNYSDEAALEVLPLHTAADIQRIQKHLDEGGPIKK